LIVPGAGDITPIDTPEVFNSAVLGFLEEAVVGWAVAADDRRRMHEG
jgi:hypothetical protein